MKDVLVITLSVLASLFFALAGAWAFQVQAWWSWPILLASALLFAASYCYGGVRFICAVMLQRGSEGRRPWGNHNG